VLQLLEVLVLLISRLHYRLAVVLRVLPLPLQVSDLLLQKDVVVSQVPAVSIHLCNQSLVSTDLNVVVVNLPVQHVDLVLLLSELLVHHCELLLLFLLQRVQVLLLYFQLIELALEVTDSFTYVVVALAHPDRLVLLLVVVLLLTL